MAFTIISIFVSASLGFFLVDLVYWLISCIIFGIITYLTFKRKTFNKLSNFIILVGIMFAFFGYINAFDPKYFYLIINISAFFAFIYEVFKRKIWIALSWLLNAFSLGYLIASLRTLNLGIIFGIIILIIGLKDVFSSSKSLNSDIN